MDSLHTKSKVRAFIEKGIEDGDLWDSIMSSVETFVLKLIFAILIYIAMKYIIRFLIRSLNILMEKKEVDKSVRHFFGKAINITLHVIAFIVIIGILGVNTTSLIALLASAGFAIGLALQGSLQNFAGGIIILFNKPFNLGDEIEVCAGDYRGIVKEIGIFTTTLLSFDNVSMIIPNSELSTKALMNYTKEGFRRIDEIIGIDYGDSVDKAREIMLGIINSDTRVLHEKGCSVVVAELSDSSVNLKVLAWVTREDYYSVKADLREKTHAQFKECGITIPFPQLQIHN